MSPEKIIKYGRLGFLSEGRIQIEQVIDDANRLAEKHSAPFIIGYTWQHEIMVAPIPKRERFVKPLSAIATGDAFWSVSDMHSHRFGESWFASDDPDYAGSFDSGYLAGPMYVLYVGCAYGEKPCGGFVAGDPCSILVLAVAIEDAVKMAHTFGKKRGHVLLTDDNIVACGALESSGRTAELSVESASEVQDVLAARPRDFLDVDSPLPPLCSDKVSDAAKKTYKKISKIRQTGCGLATRACALLCGAAHGSGLQGPGCGCSGN